MARRSALHNHDEYGGDYEGLSEGTHEIVFEASLPGTDIVLSTAPLSVELSCGDESEMGGCSMSGRGHTAPYACCSSCPWSSVNESSCEV